MPQIDPAHSYPPKRAPRRCTHADCGVMIPDEHGPARDVVTPPHGNGRYYVKPHICPECHDALCSAHCPAIRERAPLSAAKAAAVVALVRRA